LFAEKNVFKTFFQKALWMDGNSRSEELVP
jgi:hypothetical protein